MRPLAHTTLALAMAGLMPAIAGAATIGADSYFATLKPLNDSGVRGRAELTLDGNLLTVHLMVRGLEPDIIHIQHIHGRSDENGNPIDSVVPPPSADTDGDGFVEVGEGAPFYGPVLLNLVDAGGQFPTAPGGVIDFTNTFDISTIAGITPLDLREIVVHGLTVPAGVDPNVPDGGYSVSLPVAAGEIAPVPVPAAGVLLVGALGGLGLLRLRRRA
ncbi:CHRD domain-containing protein [Rubellimicrobium roseum]|uniref:CHRD domain-containing protein n=1 Tax=Rubellimicrobium roseum TaxID=687525 RepID=A0A5C4N9V0_9RHOB|nr:CHRD domain-containing protein [Rubellimicrobium roseum]TNC71611.1 hypothetical protein FHG71_10560 [Rubellimicrobium roseum]